MLNNIITKKKQVKINYEIHSLFSGIIESENIASCVCLDKCYMTIVKKKFNVGLEVK